MAVIKWMLLLLVFCSSLIWVPLVIEFFGTMISHGLVVAHPSNMRPCPFTIGIYI